MGLGLDEAVSAAGSCAGSGYMQHEKWNQRLHSPSHCTY